MHASSQRPKIHKSARSRLRPAGTFGDMMTGSHQVLADTLNLFQPGEGGDYAHHGSFHLHSR